jgi:hypothetical protein
MTTLKVEQVGEDLVIRLTPEAKAGLGLRAGDEVQLGTSAYGAVSFAATAHSPHPEPLAKRCLVLAFERFDDLPDDWRRFDAIDAYGVSTVTSADVEAFKAGWTGEMTVRPGLLNVTRWRPPAVPYDHCFIRHPDPWGEPRNWFRAIAALGACLAGELTALFFYQHEILAFNFQLTALLGQSAVALSDTAPIADVRREGETSAPCVRARWSINPQGVQAGMEERYRLRLGQAMRRFYLEMGPFQREVAYFIPPEA